jgi:hypothetical protein
MNKIQKTFFVKVLTMIVVVVSIFQFGLLPALAAPPTLLKDTLDRLKVGVNATHSLSMTLPAGGITTGNLLTVTYTGFATDFAGTPTVF